MEHGKQMKNVKQMGTWKTNENVRNKWKLGKQIRTLKTNENMGKKW